VAEASRAPSAHNTQPARWRFLPDGEVQLFEDTARRLPVADPTGRDQLVGLGAAFEGLRLAFSRLGTDLTDPEPADNHGAVAPGRPGVRLVSRSVTRPGTTPDPLGDAIFQRGTYRGPFLPADSAARTSLRKTLESTTDVMSVYDPPAIRELAELSDRASFGFLARRDYQAELYAWMRFSPRDTRWARDGLTAEGLGLSRPERIIGRWLLAPKRFAVLAGLNLHRRLVAEASRIRTASALAILHRPKDEWRLTTGRRFYRLCLEITGLGLAVRPMSALADAPECVAFLREHWHVPAGSAVINVFAIGKAPPRWRSTSPRLPPDELLVETSAP
jgi:nitroreductase